MRVAIVLWSGLYGGAETWSVALAKSLFKGGISGGVVVVGDPEPLGVRLRAASIPFESLGLQRGRQVISKSIAFSSLVSNMGPDAAILPAGGYLSAALRLGGYHGRIIAVEHGELLQRQRLSPLNRAVRALDVLSGSWSVDAWVAPSDYMLREVRRNAQRPISRRIHLGVELDSAARGFSKDSSRTAQFIIGFAGRLIRGKGVEVLLEAVSRVPNSEVRVEVAGDGPERRRLEGHASRLGITARCRFHGWIEDLRTFWRQCDIAVVPSEFPESFGMVAIEAMAQGLPVIAARNGGLAEIVADGETGALFDVGDSEALSALISSYAFDPELQRRQGDLARERVRSRFNIDRCAHEFVDLIRELTEQGRPAAAVGEA